MNFLSKLFGNLNLDVNKIVDNLVTTKEEKQELRNTLQQILCIKLC